MGVTIQEITATIMKVPLISELITLILSAILAAAITKDNVDVNKNAEANTVLVSYHFFNISAGITFDTNRASNSNGININISLFVINDQISSSTPIITKK